MLCQLRECHFYGNFEDESMEYGQIRLIFSFLDYLLAILANSKNEKLNRTYAASW